MTDGLTDDTNDWNRLESGVKARADRMGDAQLGDLLFDLHPKCDLAHEPARFREALAPVSRARTRRTANDDEFERMLGELLIDAVVGDSP